MSGVNKVILIGHLGKDPEVRNFEGGNMTAKFSLATTESYRDKTGNRVESTEWHNIVLWSKLAEVASKYLHKGSQVYIEGKIRNRSYDDKDGNKKYITEVVVDTFTMLDKKPTSGSSDGDVNSTDSHSNSNESSNPAPDDDLPF
ncbi:MAG: single-stranded DNA-binding protein [Bacteroidetes bacterium]|nr:single-stranded DNA-binding protein [Bacteroidota bacterium]MBP7398353.1 single-stranded DNA-binding protein [Chitinophagales bacterium]MBP8753098.1 single-stranded DNA-binding protein [Chitinophagales bacterium]MBP9188104.1 single-stranded DNA-binding protein [Chitinophagales bacterium]MBP9547524.1 single-stranded DNA-binding protein [Chitinophagales bacterium]